ncbi:uncharacterized protein LOC108733273 isoform X1 [Agrilus planipennis]|uniref:Uncharacterized protein LOC108733273 isoform X1 n=1 Tax=Agrilus planipennis TaxID=224129 RepID=A0A1W4W701_AGRPL|nr:uncharacterized protein LOC108733273 isoform X1 [Agrilus planipennis]
MGKEKSYHSNSERRSKTKHTSKSRSRFERFSSERTRRSRSPPPRESYTVPNERNEQMDDNLRIQKLEELVDRLIRQQSVSSEGSSNVIRMTIKADCIPEFAPGNPNLTSTKWVDKIEQLALINKWDENMIVYHMQSRLTGLARTWYNNLTTYDYSWNEWKELIKRTFPDHHDFSSTLKKLVARVKQRNETMTQYYFGKMDLLHACKIDGKDAVSCLIDGINDRTLQNSAKAGRYDTPERLYEEFLSTITDEIIEDTTSDDLNIDKRFRRRFDKKRLKFKTHSEQSRHLSFAQEPRKKRTISCYNCGSIGHVSSNCTKPRLECTKCHFLGHKADECKRWLKKKIEIKVAECNDQQFCYFVDCLINGQLTRGYVDTGCSVVTLRQSDADKLKLTRQNSTKHIKGYGGSRVEVIGETMVTLKVDLMEADVEVLIVNDFVQSVPVIVGQSFINQTNATLVIRDNQLRLFEKHLAALPEIDELEPRKITLWAQDAVVIPSNTIGIIKVMSDNYDGDVYVKERVCSKPYHEYTIPRCVTTTNGGVISLRNLSTNDLHVPKFGLLTRGCPCKPETLQNEVLLVGEDATNGSVAEL